MYPVVLCDLCVELRFVRDPLSSSSSFSASLAQLRATGKGAVVAGNMDQAFVSYPVLFKHIAFDGGFLHGVPQAMMRENSQTVDSCGRPVEVHSLSPEPDGLPEVSQPGVRVPTGVNKITDTRLPHNVSMCIIINWFGLHQMGKFPAQTSVTDFMALPVYHFLPKFLPSGLSEAHACDAPRQRVAVPQAFRGSAASSKNRRVPQ